MKILQEIDIFNFRGIKNVKIRPNSINIFVGPNNSGKSAILEAIGLLTTSIKGYKDATGKNIIYELLRYKNYNPKYLINQENFIEEDYNDYDEKKISLYECKIFGNILGQKINVELKYGNVPIEEPVLFLLRKRYIEKHTRNLIREVFRRKASRDYLYTLIFDEEDIQKIETIIGKEFQELDSPIWNKLSKIVMEDIDLKAHKMEDVEKLLILAKLNHEYFSIYAKFIDDIRYTREIRFNPLFIQTNKMDEIVYDETEIINKKLNKIRAIIEFHRTLTINKFQKLHDRLVKENQIERARELLASLIPEITDFRYTKDGGMYITKDGKTYPLSTQGEGLLSLIHHIFISTITQNGILIVEEPEITLHPRFMDLEAHSFINDIKNKQVFFSTHSTEFIDYLLEYAKDYNVLDKISIHRLFWRQDLNDLEIETLSGDQALDRMEEIKIDLRGV